MFTVKNFKSWIFIPVPTGNPGQEDGDGDEGCKYCKPGVNVERIGDCLPLGGKVIVGIILYFPKLPVE